MTALTAAGTCLTASDTPVQSACMASRRVARPEARNKGHQLAIRIPRELLRAIDEEVERLRGERPGATVQRSDAVREILYQVLIADVKFAQASATRRQARRPRG